MTGEDGTSQAQCERLGGDRIVIGDRLSPNGSLAHRAPYQAESGTIGTPRSPDTAEAG